MDCRASRGEIDFRIECGHSLTLARVPTDLPCRSIMVPERRKYPRLAKPLEATWEGASGGSPCRVVDIGWGGCFLQTPAQPAIGERAVVTAHIGKDAVALEGEVIYIERTQGFGMEFDLLSED